VHLYGVVKMVILKLLNGCIHAEQTYIYRKNQHLDSPMKMDTFINSKMAMFN
jgi:hypothetical protein